MIVNLRGTHGSGKSHLVRQVMTRFDGVPVGEDRRGKPLGYTMQLANGNQLYIVGRYDIACGGCDAIQPYADIWPRVAEFALLGHVLFEGALISTNYGTIGAASEQYGDDFVFAFLDTPLPVCLDRIIARRLAKGNTKPLNPYQTTWKHKAILSLYDRFRDERGRRTVLLNHNKALSQLLGIFYGTL
jgi:hypothetical protein